MYKHRSSRDTNIPLGRLSSDENLASADGDAGLLALEVQLDDLVAELLAAQALLNVSGTRPSEQPLLEASGKSDIRSDTDLDAVTKQVEAILARLYPIERAIMLTPARTIAGLGVKARHAAYVVSEHWNSPIDRIAWEAQAVRLLIEAVCESAGVQIDPIS
jgi:hypothetical protein